MVNLRELSFGLSVGKVRFAYWRFRVVRERVVLVIFGSGGEDGIVNSKTFEIYFER